MAVQSPGGRLCLKSHRRCRGAPRKNATLTPQERGVHAYPGEEVGPRSLRWPQCPPVLCVAPKDSPVVADEACGLASSKRLSKSSIDVSSVPEDEEPQRPLPRKQSDSSTYDCEAITQHHAFLSR